MKKFYFRNAFAGSVLISLKLETKPIANILYHGNVIISMECDTVGIVIEDQSRLGRDYLQTGMLMEITFPQYDVRFIAINDGVDSENGISDFSGIKNYFNKWIYVKCAYWNLQTRQNPISRCPNWHPNCCGFLFAELRCMRNSKSIHALPEPQSSSTIRSNCPSKTVCQR